MCTDKLDEMTGFIVIFCTSRAEAVTLSTNLLQNGIYNVAYGGRVSQNRLSQLSQILLNAIKLKYFSFFSVCDEWAKTNIIQLYSSDRNILICDDYDFLCFPIYIARHVIHYTLPTELSVFLKRFDALLNTCDAIVADSITIRGTDKQLEYLIQMSSYLCLNYRNYQLSSSIFDFLIERISIDWNCKESAQVSVISFIVKYHSRKKKIAINQFVVHNLQGIAFALGQMKWKKSICMRLITKGDDCPVGCPHRHFIITDDNFLPCDGEVRLKLLDAVSTNRYAAHITHHRNNSSNDWSAFHRSSNAADEFELKLKMHFKIFENQKKLATVGSGEKCAVFLNDAIFRAKVVSSNKDDTRYRLLLIDIGKSYVCERDCLLQLPTKFHNFPAQTVEVILMGIDLIPSYRANAIAKLTKWIKLSNSDSNNYCSARIINAFERILLVHNLKCYISNRQKSIEISKNLISYGYTQQIPIQLCEIETKQFLDEERLSPVQSTPKKNSMEENSNLSLFHNSDVSLIEPMHDAVELHCKWENNGAAFFEISDSHISAERKMKLDGKFNFSQGTTIAFESIPPSRLAENKTMADCEQDNKSTTNDISAFEKKPLTACQMMNVINWRKDSFIKKNV